MAGALTKLLLRLRKSTDAEATEVNKLTAEAMLYIVSILRLGESQASLHPRDDDAVDRMVTCLKVHSAVPKRPLGTILTDFASTSCCCGKQASVMPSHPRHIMWLFQQRVTVW